MSIVNLKSIFGVYQWLQKAATHSLAHQIKKMNNMGEGYQIIQITEEIKKNHIVILQRMFNNIRHPIPCRLDP